MRAAPAVSVSIGVSRSWQGVQALLWAMACSALCAWLLARIGHDAAWGLCAALPTGIVAWRLVPGRPQVLYWDGEQWLLDTKPVRLTVALDLGSFLLLTMQLTEAAKRRHWLPATAAQAGAHWHGLRAALYSRAPESPQAAAPPHGASAPD